MSFTNAQLAQSISDMIEHWSGFAEEYANWLGGTTTGGPGSDGSYPLNDWLGNESLVKSPAKLQDDVDGQVSSASVSAGNAATSETNAAASASTATTQAGLADTARIAAELAETNAQTAESSAINEAVTAVAQAAVATAKAVLTAADVVLTNADVVSTNADVVSTNADAVSTAADAAATAADVASIDIANVAHINVAETITGIWRHDAALRLDNNIAINAINVAATSWREVLKMTASDNVQVGHQLHPLRLYSDTIPKWWDGSANHEVVIVDQAQIITGQMSFTARVGLDDAVLRLDSRGSGTSFPFEQRIDNSSASRPYWYLYDDANVKQWDCLMTTGGSIQWRNVGQANEMFLSFVPNEGVRIRDGLEFRVYDPTDVDYLSIKHDGVDTILQNNNSNVMRFKGASNYIFQSASGGLWVTDAADTDWIQILHTGTFADFAFNNTTALRVLGGVPLRVYDSGNTDYVGQYHDGAGYYFDAFQTTRFTFQSNDDAANIVIEHFPAAINETTPGLTQGSIHFKPGILTSEGNAITWGATDSGAGETAQAGIYVVSDSGYGSRMHFATTNSYGAGAQTALSIDQTGAVDILRARLNVAVGNVMSENDGCLALGGVASWQTEFGGVGTFIDVQTTIGRLGVYDYTAGTYEPLQIITDDINFLVGNGGTSVMTMNSSVIDVLSGVDFRIRDGGYLRVYDTADIEFAMLDSGNVVAAHVGLWLHQPTPSVTNYSLLSDSVSNLLVNSAASIFMRLANVNKLTIASSLITSAVDLTVNGDILATTYGGITEANLLDKTAAETISGVYDFTAAPLKSALGIPYYVTTGYVGGKVTVSSTTPSSPTKGDIWFDTT